ncbi:MAG: UDP-2,3-diacylglucosamine diphosphatase [Polaromonas sp.]|nr:UDP-2,3-diacylglucosamine diphosphatase [Polaromonas sp.]
MRPPSTLPPVAELVAPPSWCTVDFISDLHLHAGDAATLAVWQAYLAQTPADAVFMLGDLFEVWVGDDCARPDGTAAEPSFESACAQVLRQAAGQRALFFMHGNRDFLVGNSFTDNCRTALLQDPTALSFAGQRWLLSHGDALCLDDLDYMEFRRLVRSAGWQAAFLARPLAERQELARGMRQQSEARKRTGANYGDVDNAAARHWLQAAHAPALIHGHTHQPAQHDLGGGMSRIVLSDWDAAAPVPRAEVLRLDKDGGLRRISLLPA